MSGIGNVSTFGVANVSLYGGMKGMHQDGSVKAQESTDNADRAAAPEAKKSSAAEGPMDANCGMKDMRGKEGPQQKGNAIDFRV